MTTEEAIRYLEPIVENASLKRYKAALGLAIAALRAHQAIENRVWESTDHMTVEEAIEIVEYAAAFNAENSPLTRKAKPKNGLLN